MKKTASLVLALIIVVSLAACTVSDIPNETTVPTEATVLTSQSTEQSTAQTSTVINRKPYAYEFEYCHSIQLRDWRGIIYDEFVTDFPPMNV